MTTATQTIAKSGSNVLAIIAAGFIGLGVVFIAGHAQSGALHDAAHDVRHATGFPCH